MSLSFYTDLALSLLIFAYLTSLSSAAAAIPISSSATFLSFSSNVRPISQRLIDVQEIYDPLFEPRFLKSKTVSKDMLGGRLRIVCVLTDIYPDILPLI